MKRVVLLTLFIIIPCFADSQFDHFIHAENGLLYDGHSEYRFISCNIPELHFISDHLDFCNSSNYRLPDDFEIRDAFRSIRQIGGTVVRIGALPIQRPGDGNNTLVYISAPGVFNENAFQVLDRILYYANEMGIRLIIPLVDDEEMWGGTAAYAAYHGLSKYNFWTDTHVIADFEKTIEYIVNRYNVFTNTQYKDDRAILAWETGNQLQCPQQWTFEIARYIKEMDPNHLVLDGLFTPVIMDSSLQNPYIDMVATQHSRLNTDSLLIQVEQNQFRAQGVKPYILSEVGCMQAFPMERLLDVVIQKHISGALLTSLFFHNRDGGFYWHSGEGVNNVYKAYHWPGFLSGQEYDETRILNVIHRKAYRIRNEPVPPLPVPETPELMPITDVAAINWQGTAGASAYRVERAASLFQGWQVIGQSVSDAQNPYRPLFHDKTAELGKSYYYRVAALNSSGSSQPSRRKKSVKVKYLTLVDEFVNNEQMLSLTGSFEFLTHDARCVREDMDRLSAQPGTQLIYKVPMAVQFMQLSAMFPDSLGHLNFAVSQNGINYITIPPQVKACGQEQKPASYRSVLYELRRLPNYTRFIRIDCTTRVELTRLEIKYGH